MTPAVVIRRYLDVERDVRLERAIDAIFFEASNTKSFASESARSAFRERWLGRYLREEPHYAYLALANTGDMVGYLVGSFDARSSDTEAAEASGFSAFRDVSRRYPAHLHVNMAPQYRGFGIGARLIEAFVADLRQANATGVHVITSATSPNVRFYTRNAFVEVGCGGPDGSLVCLARTLV